MSALVVVDFSNFVHTCWWPAVSAEKADPKYVATEVLLTNIRGKLGTIANDLSVRGFNDVTYLFAEDRMPKAKLELFPLYKSNRDRDPNAIDPRPIAKEYLKKNGYTNFCHSPDNEADDVIATLVHQHKDPTIIVSSDKDMWQLCSETDEVFVYRVTLGKFVTSEMILEEFGVNNPIQIPLHKALWGDVSDAIPNVIPRMQKQLIPVINTVFDIDGFFKQVAYEKLTDRCRQLLTEGEAQVRLNYELVKLKTGVPIVFEGEA